MSSATLRKIAYVTPRTEIDPHEVQRIVSESRAIEIGEYIKSAESLLPNAIVLNLESSVKIDETALSNLVTINFPSTEGKFAYILDGQHRLAGFKHTGGIEFDLPVVSLHGATEAQRIKVFADINSKQQQVTKVQLAALYHQIRAGLPDDMKAMDVVVRLADDPDSPLFEKVQVRDDQKRRWVRNSALKVYVAPLVTGGGELAPKSVDEQARILKEYLGAAAELWPVEWNDRKLYSLTYPIGLETLFGVFEAVKKRVDLHHASQYTKSNFQKVMTPLSAVSVSLGDAAIAVNWDRGSMTPFANAGGRKALREAFKAALVKADETSGT